MARTTTVAVVGLCLTGALVLSACTGADTTGSSTKAAGDGAGKPARIYVVAPFSGASAGQGLGVRNAVQMTVDQAVARGDFPGWKVEVVPLDDKGDPNEAAAVAQKAASDDATVAVIGSIFSGLTKQVQQPLTPKGIPHVSPSATNPTLSKGDDYATKPRRTHPNFFRVIAPDDAHAPALARYVRSKGVKRVFVVHDGDSYGQGLAEVFSTAFTQGKGRIVGTAQVDPAKPAVYPELVSTIVEADPQAVMFGGIDAQAGPLSGQLKEKLNIPVIGGDGVATEAYVPWSGPVSAGDLSTAAGAPVSTVENGKQFLADYDAAGFGGSPMPYGPLAADATVAVLTALKTSLPQASSAAESRPGTVKALAETTFDGTSGKVAFDEYGDITPRVVTVNVLNGGQWKPAETITVE